MSEYRLGWTTESLNFTLPLQKSIGDLRISHYTRTTMHVKGLLPDVTKLVDHIKEKNRMNNSELTKTKNFNATFWYTYPPQKHKIVRPSDTMEEAYTTLGISPIRNLFLKIQMISHFQMMKVINSLKIQTIYSVNNTAYITNVLISISVDCQSVGVVCSHSAFVLVVFTDFRPL